MLIYIVDNDWLNLHGLKKEITKVTPNAEVRCFNRGTKALEAAKKQKCDVLFTEVDLLSVSGYWLAKKFKEINPKINIIFTAVMKEYANELLDIHFSGYLIKPITVEDLEFELGDLRYPVGDGAGIVAY